MCDVSVSWYCVTGTRRCAALRCFAVAVAAVAYHAIPYLNIPSILSISSYNHTYLSKPKCGVRESIYIHIHIHFHIYPSEFTTLFSWISFPFPSHPSFHRCTVSGVGIGVRVGVGRCDMIWGADEVEWFNMMWYDDPSEMSPSTHLVSTTYHTILHIHTYLGIMVIPISHKINLFPKEVQITQSSRLGIHFPFLECTPKCSIPLPLSPFLSFKQYIMDAYVLICLCASSLPLTGLLHFGMRMHILGIVE